jgi:hypothetical protein
VIVRRSPRTPTTCRPEGNYHSHQTTVSNTVSYVSESFFGSPVARKVPDDLLVLSGTQEKPQKCEVTWLTFCNIFFNYVPNHLQNKL